MTAVLADLSPMDVGNLDRLAAALEDAEDRGWTASRAAQAIGVDTDVARGYLAWLVDNGNVHSTGTGRTVRYHPGRA